MQLKDSQPTRLLAIDDSVLIHRLLKSHLQHEPIELHGALSGIEGLKMAEMLRPSVILLDLDMAGTDGFEVLVQLKCNPVTQNIPVIFLSANCSIDQRVRALDLGAIDFITKPFHISELKARVRSAIRQTRLIAMLSQRAQIDGMTGLWNRTYFDERLQQEIAAAERHDHNLALIICDIDHFKKVNDTFGHPFGDHVLEEFAAMLTDSRISDIICRYGGEEFAMIITHASANDAFAAAERLRSRIEQHEWAGHPDLQITVSFGISELQQLKDRQPLSLIEAADRALYAAKESGRNCVKVAKQNARQDVTHAAK